MSLLSKSSELLAMGLGEAGSKLIHSQLNQKKSTLLKTGEKVYCVFGFCQIRDFRNIMETLGTSILSFVKKVSTILHEEVHSHLGYANKNLGEVYLLVWKFDYSELALQYGEEVYSLLNSRKTSRVVSNAKKRFSLELKTEVKTVTRKCDLAIIAFIRSLVRIQTNQKLANYCMKKNVNFPLDARFGMHCGWAIEGAIGSFSKIDTRYALFIIMLYNA